MGEKWGLPRRPLTIEHPLRHRELPRNNPSHFPPPRFSTGFSTGCRRGFPQVFPQASVDPAGASAPDRGELPRRIEGGSLRIEGGSAPIEGSITTPPAPQGPTAGRQHHRPPTRTAAAPRAPPRGSWGTPSANSPPGAPRHRRRQGPEPPQHAVAQPVAHLVLLFSST